jgi:oligopeptide transport system substrate-binding protein
MFKQKSSILWLVALVVLGLVIAACQPQTETVVVTSVVTETVVETVTIEGEAVEVTRVVETTVVETVTVEVEAPAEEAEMAKVLRVNLGTYPDIIDPQKSSFVNEIAHLGLMYEGVTKLNTDLETVPGAAESWEYNEDATQLTFHLKEGLTYSDGSPLNAKRFEYAFIRNINPETAGEYASITDEILGAPEWRTGLITDTEAMAAAEATVRSSVIALDSTGAPCATAEEGGYEQADCLTLQLTFSRPAPYFHTVAGLWVGYPAKEELIAEGGDNWWNSSKYQIGNGPYVLQSLEPFVRGYFTPNPNYWEGVGNVDIEYSYITDSAIAFQAYANNEFDVIGLAAEDLATVENDPVLAEEALIYPGSCTLMVQMHQLKEPFSDAKVREAFALALDRDAWVADVLQGLGSPTLTWIPPGYPGYDPDETRWAYDPEAAVQALNDSTYGGVDGLPPIELTFADSPRNRTRFEWLAAKWKEVLGVELTLTPVEPTTFTNLQKDVTTAPPMYVGGWCADYPDPQNWLSVYWRTGAFGERIGYSNAEFDELVNAADVETDPAARAELYQQAQDVLVGSLPGAFMYNTVNPYLVKPWVTGITTTPQDHGFPGSGNPIAIDIDTAMQQGQ